jgi:hypothetical protein
MASTDYKETLEFTYDLYFHENIESPDNTVPELALVQRATTSLIHNNLSFDIELNEVEFLRKLYQPGCITANLQIIYQDAIGSEAPVMLSQDDLKTILLQRRTTLGIAPKDAEGPEIIIAENYYVHEITPQVIKDSMKSMLFVKLCMYSMDKLMTLHRASRSLRPPGVQDHPPEDGRRRLRQHPPDMRDASSRQAPLRRPDRGHQVAPRRV